MLVCIPLSICLSWTDFTKNKDQHMLHIFQKYCNVVKYMNWVAFKTKYYLYFSCTQSRDTLYYGERCEHSTSNLQSLPSKLTILAISGGVGGGLLLIIFVSTVCFCYRLKSAKRHGYIFTMFLICFSLTVSIIVN